MWWFCGIDDLKLELAIQLEMKDLDTLHYFLGIEVAYSPKRYIPSQSKYIWNILKQAYLSNTKLIDSHIKLYVKYADGVSLSYSTLYLSLTVFDSVSLPYYTL